jgi:hypothetical protein
MKHFYEGKGTSVSSVLRYYPKGSYLIRLQDMQGCDARGTVTFPRTLKSCPFSSTWEMVKIIQEDIERNHFPQSTFELRIWDGNDKSCVHAGHAALQEGLADKNGIASFLVQIKYCQNATWQGSIQWIEREKAQCFRSAFEMLNLIEEAYATEQEKMWESILDG